MGGGETLQACLRVHWAANVRYRYRVKCTVTRVWFTVGWKRISPFHLHLCGLLAGLGGLVDEEFMFGTMRFIKFHFRLSVRVLLTL